MEFSQTVKNLLFILILGLSSFLLGRCTSPSSTQDKGGVLTSKQEVRVDTIVINHYITHDTSLTKPKLVLVYRDKLGNSTNSTNSTKPIQLTQADGTPTLSVRKYQDTLTLSKDLRVHYTAHTTGTLDSLKLGVIDTRPERLVMKTVTTTNTLTLTKRPTGFYVGGFISKSLTNYGPEIQLVRPKFSLGVGYDIQSSTPQLRVGFKIGKSD